MTETFDYASWENDSELTASNLIKFRQGKITPKGFFTPKVEQDSQMDVAFRGGISASIAQEFLSMKKVPQGSTKNNLLKRLVYGLIEQNPPRKIRAWSKLPKTS